MIEIPLVLVVTGAALGLAARWRWIARLTRRRPYRVELAPHGLAAGPARDL